MIQIPININDVTPEAEQQFLTDLALSFGYQETLPDADGNLVPNPETKDIFVASKTFDHWKSFVKRYLLSNKQDQAVTEVEQQLATVSTDEISIVVDPIVDPVIPE